ncbi:hypothetical protein Kpol_1033p10 [Vanderwaltozyma polyspora DSM 70294]|uniref:Purine-cytosine permease n=1 Tax=Vanderwaltozyma polyspora (strain ATCC 22028 / DSM 70294 / BCRC 21397 / CBS 2163 / NBRC 10782 / NRRL Y-8283 / UCD 57-17) TaxID=436907 RepID=A7TJ08_VANPO|nr:uncharacterized protein Kpol_1033p10 [Vanderwaltozyma polyspora DSM 70294]EDO17707.1 hypothetical protein Kpol_1033p10 [Vanderwaltozyma polyspora DSM 70294]
MSSSFVGKDRVLSTELDIEGNPGLLGSVYSDSSESHDVTHKTIASEKKEPFTEFNYTADDELDDTSSGINNQLSLKNFTFFNKIGSILNAETKGIEPVTDDEKDDNSVLNAASMWFSANMVVASYALGVIGPLAYGLNFGTSVLTIIFFNLIGMAPVAFFSVFGAEFGLRQMVLSRFLVGNVTARIFAFINVIACAGWGIINTIASAQLISIVNPGPHHCPPWAGVLIIIGGTIMVSLFGYRVIHTYEKYCWIPNFAVFLVIIARLARSGNFSNGPWGGGANTAGGVLSFGSAIYGFAAGWATYASDYTVYMPRNTNKYKIFFSVSVGLTIPLLFTQILGAAAAMGTFNDPVWKEYYDKYSVGGLTFAILSIDSVGGFGQFCCVLLALSTIAINIPNMYSIALSAQSLWNPLSKVPRVFWTLLGNIAVIAIAIPAYYKFEKFLTNFMDSISYYLAVYICIACSEHFIWRRGFKGYNPEDWNSWDKLPIGIAGCTAFGISIIGIALGMAQSYWVGNIARLIGTDGGDIGFELASSWAFIIYNILRPLELKYFGR